MKNKLPYRKVSSLFSRLSAKLVTFLHLKTEFHRTYVQTLFTNFSVVAGNATYYGKTKRHFKERMGKHFGI